MAVIVLLAYLLFKPRKPIGIWYEKDGIIYSEF